MRKRPVLIGSALIAAIPLFVAACGSSNNAASGSGKALVLGYSEPFLFSDYETAQQNAVTDVAKAAGFKVLPATNANGDSGKQNSDIRSLISAGATGLIVVANDSKAIIPALDYAQSKGVPVVSIDIGPDGGHLAMIVRADNIGMGAIACTDMAKALGDKGKVLSLEGAQTSINGRERTQGFADCMQQNHPNITLIQRPTDWDAQKQVGDLQTVLTANPDLGGVFQQADYALAATLAVETQLGHGAKVGQSGHIYNVSIDATPQGLGLVRSGVMDAEISQPVNLYAKYGVQYLKMAIQGQTLPGAGTTDHNTKVVIFNGNAMDLMPATLVTAANVDDKSLWANTLTK
jgi:ABC-type sugar transport system substrate-binding protein